MIGGPAASGAALSGMIGTVAQLVAAARCSRCRAKIVGAYRIMYGGRSAIAMARTGQMPQDT